MGIPHGGFGQPGGVQRMKSEEIPIKPAKGGEQDFPSFEDTFKPAKKPETKSNTSQHTTPIKEQPSQEQEMPLPKENKKPEAFEVSMKEQTPKSQNGSEPAQKRKNVPPPPPVDPNSVLNVDEIQIKPKQQLTFEELLEKELNDKENKVDTLPADDDRVIRKKPKKEFLKRTKKSMPPKGRCSHNLFNLYNNP